jgi:hypothetical protein
MDGREAVLGRWKAMAGDTSPGRLGPENLAGFFQGFRPDRRGLSEAFESVLGADEIRPRLLEISEVTADGSQQDGRYDGYFVVRNPRPYPPAVRRTCFACIWSG